MKNFLSRVFSSDSSASLPTYITLQYSTVQYSAVQCSTVPAHVLVQGLEVAVCVAEALGPAEPDAKLPARRALGLLLLAPPLGLGGRVGVHPGARASNEGLRRLRKYTWCPS